MCNNLQASSKTMQQHIIMLAKNNPISVVEDISNKPSTSTVLSDSSPISNLSASDEVSDSVRVGRAVGAVVGRRVGGFAIVG